MFPVVIVPKDRQAEIAAMSWPEVLAAEGLEMTTGVQGKEGKQMPDVKPGFCSFYEGRPGKPFIYQQNF